MKKTFLLTSFVFILLFSSVSCMNKVDDSLENITSVSVSDIAEGQSKEVVLNSNSILALDGYDDSQAISISIENENKSFSSKVATRSRGGDLGFSFSQGSLIPTPHENKHTEIKAVDMLIENGTKLIISHIEAKGDDTTLTYQDTISQNQNTSNSNYLLGKEYYLLEISQDKRNTKGAIIQAINNCGDYMNPDYGYVTNDYVSLFSDISSSIHGLFDVPNRPHLLMFNSIVLGKNQNNENGTITLSLQIPKKVSNTPITIDKINSFKVETEDLDLEVEYALVISPGSEMTYKNYSIFDGWYQNPRTIGQNNNGKGRMFMTPIQINTSPFVLYVGKITESFIFDCWIKDKEEGPFGTIQLVAYDSTLGTAFQEDYKSTYSIDFSEFTTKTDENNKVVQVYSKTFNISKNQPFNSIMYENLPLGTWKLSISHDMESGNAHATFITSDITTSSGGCLWFDSSIDDYSVTSSGTSFGVLFFRELPDGTLDKEVTVTLTGLSHNKVCYDSENKCYICQDENCGEIFDTTEELIEMSCWISGTWEAQTKTRYGSISFSCSDSPSNITLHLNGIDYKVDSSCVENNFFDEENKLYLKFKTKQFGWIKMECIEFKPNAYMKGVINGTPVDFKHTDKR